MDAEDLKKRTKSLRCESSNWLQLSPTRFKGELFRANWLERERL